MYRGLMFTRGQRYRRTTEAMILLMFLSLEQGCSIREIPHSLCSQGCLPGTICDEPTQLCVRDDTALPQEPDAAEAADSGLDAGDGGASDGGTEDARGDGGVSGDEVCKPGTCSGCCSGSICKTPEVEFCGTQGAACMVCNINRANN